MMKQNDSTNRLEYMDIFRGFGIVLMIMGHVYFGSRFDFFIHAFHMPMFFVISGFFFKSSYDVALSVFIRKKARALLVPYILFGLFHYVVNIFLYHNISLDPLKHLLFINTTGLPIAGALWFLTALFITEVIYFLIDRYITNAAIRWIVIIGIAGFGNCAGNILPFTMPYAMGAAMVGVGLFHMGYQIRRYENFRLMQHILNMPFYQWIICTAATIFFIFQNGYINMRAGIYDGILFFWINVGLAVIVGINCSKYIYNLIHDTYICKWLCSIGSNSIVYVCLNEFVILVVMNYFPNLFSWWFLIQISVFCISMLILLLCSILFTQTRLKVLIGKS